MTPPAADEPPRPFLREPPDDLCLGFVNTKFWRGTATPTEQLHTPADLLAWCESTGVWPTAMLQPTRGWWEQQPAEAEAALSGAIALREALFRVFAATASGSMPASADLGALNAALAAAPSRARLRPQGDGFVWELPGRPEDHTLPFAPVPWSAGALLTGGRLGRVRQCANPQCLWLFLDDSKSGNRRWCSMAMCGNRAKAHRHYARQRQAR